MHVLTKNRFSEHALNETFSSSITIIKLVKQVISCKLVITSAYFFIVMIKRRRHNKRRLRICHSYNIKRQERAQIPSHWIFVLHAQWLIHTHLCMFYQLGVKKSLTLGFQNGYHTYSLPRLSHNSISIRWLHSWICVMSMRSLGYTSSFKLPKSKRGKH